MWSASIAHIVATMAVAAHAGVAQPHHTTPPPPAPPRPIVAPVRRIPVWPTPWCFLGTLANDCQGAGPLFSCPQSDVWPDPSIPCHWKWS